MTGTRAAQAELSAVEAALWPHYLTQRSGLPGPRANLTLVQAAACVADDAAISALLRDGREYTTMCAAAAVSRRADQRHEELMARSLAADERWRVREGVVIGLQLLGERSFGALTATVSRWVDDQDPLVQRAAVAAICEPRLLRSPEAAGQAVAMCQRATRHLVEVPRGERARPGVRVLRQALGYCWSVAVAASPVTGLPVFAGLDVSDPDVAWLVKENSRKKRLAALL